MKASRSRCIRVALIFASPLWLGACFFSSSDEPRQQDDAVEATSQDAGNVVEPASPRAPMPPPFSMPFEALITQPVRWAALDVSVTGARQVRGIGEPDGSLYGKPQTDKIYVELTLKLDNRGAEEVDYSYRATWDLVLANGDRLQSIDPLGVSVLPGDSASATVHYPLANVVDLAGAKLVLDGAERGELEPEEIPLDVTYEQ